MTLLRTSAAASVAISCLLQSASAQCATGWVANSPLSSFNTPGFAITDWDPDGPGPMTERLVVSWHNFTSAGVMMWDDATTSWLPIGNANSRVDCLLAMPNGDLYAGGNFVTIGGVAANGVARWDGANWSPLGAGVENPSWPGTVSSMTGLPGGDLIVGGSFSSAGGQSAYCIAQWNGTAWSPLSSGTNGTVASLNTLDNGEIIAAGSFSQAGGVPCAHVARWNGSIWSPVGTAITSHVDAVEIAADGIGMIAGSGSFVWQWGGASWTQLPLNNVYSTDVLLLPNGDVIAAGILGSVVRWNGSTWTDLALPHFGLVSALHAMANGDVLVVGDFRDAAGAHLPSIEVLASSCPATATTVDAGCGATLVAEQLPWIGSDLVTSATGLPANSLAVAVRGLTVTFVPLGAILPEGQLACELLPSADLLELILPNAGAASSSLTVPHTPALAGVEIYEQWLSLQLGAGLEILDLSASNTLELTVGAF